MIKIASKRGPDILRSLFNDFEKNAVEGEYFNSYYDKQGKDYFYQLLKPLADNTTLQEGDFIDWGQAEKFKPEIGIGECAGVVIDLVATLFYEAEEKLSWSAEAFSNEGWGDSIYQSYAAVISGAKALLLDKQVHVNTHHNLIADFDKYFIETGEISLGKSFSEFALQINKREPSKEFASDYFLEASEFLKKVKTYRSKNKVEETISLN